MRSPRVLHDGPAASLLAYAAGRLWLGACGWTVEGELPRVPKAILIAAPHTTAWDGPFMLAVAWVFRLKLNWIAKHTLFVGWQGPVLRWLGALPIDRRAPQGQVADVAQRIREADGIILAIAPEGTRAQTELWKSGFYHIAREAQVPILCGFLDYRRKVGGVGPAFIPTGDIEADMDRIRAFYRGITGMKPDGFAEPRLREELLAVNSRHLTVDS